MKPTLASLMISGAVVMGVWAQSASVPSPSVMVKPMVVAPDVATTMVENYVNSLTTLKAAFTQRSTGEQWTQEGTFYLNKPKGQFVWDYASPDRQRLIATGTALYFVNDEQGGAVTTLPVRSGLSRLFQGRKLNLAKERLKVSRALSTTGMTKVDLVPVGKDAEMGAIETISLTFNTTPLRLMAADVTDATGAVTTITLADVQTGLALDKKLFAFTPKRTR